MLVKHQKSTAKQNQILAFYFYLLNKFWFTCESFVTATSGGNFEAIDDLINGPPIKIINLQKK